MIKPWIQDQFIVIVSFTNLSRISLILILMNEYGLFSEVPFLGTGYILFRKIIKVK